MLASEHSRLETTEQTSGQTVGVSRKASSQRDVDGEEEPSAAASRVSAASRYPETARLIPEMELLTSK